MQEIYNCPNCNAEVTYGQPSCSSCGTAMDWGDAPAYSSESGHQQQESTGYQQEVYECPACGGQVMYGESSCVSCGSPFYWEQPQQEYQFYDESQKYEQQQYYNQPLMQQQYNQYQYNRQAGNRKRKPKAKPLPKSLLLIIAAFVFVVVGVSILIAINPGSSEKYQIASANTSGPDWVPNTQPKIRSFIANPREILTGQSTTLSWDVAGATAVSIDHDIGSVQSSGSVNLTPESTSTYVITASNSFGTTTTETLITVNPVPPVINSFTANPLAITAGQSTSLQWNITGATKVEINQGVGIVEKTGSKSVSPFTTITYILTASNTAGTKTASIQVTVTPLGAPTILSFTASPSTIIAGQSSTLQWMVSGATSITIDQGIGDVTSNLTYVVTPTTSTTYTLAAVNSAGAKTATVSVNVTSASSLAINSFSANPTYITTSGGSATLNWSTTGATQVSIDNGIGTVSTSGAYPVTPSSNTTYILTASNSSNTITRSVTVYIDTSWSAAPVITSFTAAANGVAAGTNITVPSGTEVTFMFSTAVNNVSTARIDPEPGNISSSTVSLIVSTTRTYTLTVSNSAGQATATVTVTVQ